MTPDDDATFATADRISDRIRGVMRDEVAAMVKGAGVEPLQLLAGQLLPLVSFLRTIPDSPRTPPSIVALRAATEQCLSEIVEVQRRLAAEAS